MAYHSMPPQLRGAKIDSIDVDELNHLSNKIYASDSDFKRVINQNKIRMELIMEKFDKQSELNYVTSSLPFAKDIVAQHNYHKANSRFALNIIALAVKSQLYKRVPL